MKVGYALDRVERVEVLTDSCTHVYAKLINGMWWRVDGDYDDTEYTQDEFSDLLMKYEGVGCLVFPLSIEDEPALIKHVIPDDAQSCVIYEKVNGLVRRVERAVRNRNDWFLQMSNIRMSDDEFTYYLTKELEAKNGNFLYKFFGKSGAILK